MSIVYLSSSRLLFQRHLPIQIQRHQFNHYHRSATLQSWFGKNTTPKTWFGRKPSKTSEETASATTTPIVGVPDSSTSNNNVASTTTAAVQDPSTSTSTASTSSRLSKWKSAFIIYWKGILKEYQNALIEAFQDGKSKPFRSTLYLSLVAAIIYLIYSNPSEDSFYAEFIKNREEFDLVGEPIRSHKTQEYLSSLSQLSIGGRLRYLNLLFGSVIWKHDADEQLGLYYETQCSYLKPVWTEILTERVVDVGFGNRWWKSTKIMEDYDINENEWEGKQLQSI